jgi:hypothetical protein
MTKDEICGLLRQIHDVLAMQSETNQVKSTSDYERGVIDGMLKQAESSVDRAVNAMAKRTGTPQDGMALRDYFAATAVAGIVQCTGYATEKACKAAAECAYWVADAMLKAREA